MPTKKMGNSLVTKHVRMWPREVFDVIGTGEEKLLAAELRQPGICILYRDDEPYYVGNADNIGHDSARTPPILGILFSPSDLRRGKRFVFLRRGC